MSVTTTGVGILGCGPVSQAIHIPTIDRLRDSFHIANVMDVNAEVAESVAGRSRARGPPMPTS